VPSPGGPGPITATDEFVWFAEPNDDAIGRISLTGEVTEYPLTTQYQEPRRVVVVLASVGRGSLGLPEGMTGPGPSTLIEPAPPGLEPRITKEDALGIAWREEGRRDATSVTAALAVMRTSDQEGTKETPVWIVTYEGVCVLAHGPPQNPMRGECVASTWGVMIDTMTGEFLVADV